ncbi:MAG TPA: sulfotransferase family protein [Devosia sp.]|nr:sulfotransferase family protein [Devosia sp.]
MELNQALNHAVAAHQAGNLVAAERGYRQVLKAIPNQPVALNLLGLIAISQGKNARAVQLLQKAIVAKPDFADAFNHLGVAQRKLAQHERAVKSFSRAVALDPALTEAHNNLGNVHKDLLAFEAAAQCYQRAIALEGKNFEPHYNLGNVLRELERLEPARQSYRNALALNPNHIEARFNLAALLERSHDLPGAMEAVEEVLSRAPGMAGALVLKAKILRRGKQETEAAAVLEGVDAASLAPEDGVSVCFEMGRIYDALGRPEQAFAHFARGNQMQKSAASKEVMREARRFRQGIEETLEQLLPGIADNWQNIGASDRQDPVFLIGFPRSGTTLLDQVLDAHPLIQVMEERPVVPRLVKNLGSSGKPLPNDYAHLTGEEAELLRAEYFEQASRHLELKEGSLLVDKMPLNILYVPLIVRLFSDARFIFALRHPADVVLSNFMQLYRLNGAMANFLELESAADTYCAIMELWKKCRTALPVRVHTIRYEGLVTDLEEEVRPLLEFLDVDWSDAVLDPTGHARVRDGINTPSYEQVAEPVYLKSRYRWRQYRNELAPVLGRLEPWAERLGYSLNDGF